ncbi:MAG TPA: LytTR family DNA-binding domain-containing protein [Puia sp.]|jgi:two-component system LytT family response regulator|nr:LytTR family DNA-binding domain-containing protein [Puia sp.]
MLKCIAVDDEPLALHLLTDYISKVPFLGLLGTAGDAFEAAKLLQEKPVDLIFIDIQMPGLTGLQFIQSLAKRPMVIIITAYKKFAPEGFDLDVVDYLVKPVGLDRFMKACNKAQELYELRTAATAIAGSGGAGAATPNTAEFFFVNVDYSLVKVLFADIIWIEGSGDYVKIHLKSAPKPLLVRTSAKTLESELPAEKFLRIHKSYIVAVASITAIRKNSVFIGDLELPVGETYRDALRQLTGRDL